MYPGEIEYENEPNNFLSSSEMAQNWLCLYDLVVFLLLLVYIYYTYTCMYTVFCMQNMSSQGYRSGTFILFIFYFKRLWTQKVWVCVCGGTQLHGALALSRSP